jgi:hypothetical protein
VVRRLLDASVCARAFLCGRTKLDRNYEMHQFEEIAREKRRLRYAAYRSQWMLPGHRNHFANDNNAIDFLSRSSLFGELELGYFDVDGTELIRRLAAGDPGYSAVEVISAHCKRASMADQLLNW